MSVDTDEQRLADSSIRDLLSRWYHVPALVLVVLFMFWVRIQNYGAFTSEERITFQAIDPWYHWRTTTWTVERFPWLPGFDPWSGFPEGAFAAQFGTLFDWFVAILSFIIGLGSPTTSDIQVAALVSVPLLAALVALPVYAIGKRVGGRAGGLAGVIFLALAPGSFLRRTTVGFFDHVAAEVLMMTVSVFAMVLALQAIKREPPAWELVTAGEWGALRRPIAYSALVGVLLTLYIWTWPPAVVLIGIFGVYVVLQLTLDFLRGESPDHVAFVAVVSMLIVTLLTLTRIQEPGFSATALGYLHPTLAFLVAAGAAFMAWLARQWEHEGYDRTWYPVAIGASIVGALIAMALLLPDLYGTLINNLSGRIMPFGYNPGGLTIGEAQPPDNPAQFMFGQYGLAFFTGVIGLVWLGVRATSDHENRRVSLLVVVWSAFLISMGLTQIRFNYYLVTAVAVLNAFLVGIAIDMVDLSGGIDALRGIETYQILTIGVVVMMLFVPLFPPLASASALQVGDSAGPGATGETWAPANDWLANNTPEVGNYGSASNADQIDYYGDFSRPSDGNYDYPEGAYGVMSWWDYGHLITVQGERIPHANPFQQNARSASAFLTAQNESTAELYLDAIATDASPTHESDKAALRDRVAQNETDEPIQYVMIDDQMAAGKFPAITQWTGPDYGSYLDQETIRFPQNDGAVQNRTLRTANENFQQTMLSKLYLQDASGLEHYRLVNETDSYSLVGYRAAQIPNSDRVVGQRTSVGLGSGYDQGLAQNISLARQANQAISGYYDAHVESSVKTYERVEGATLTGQADVGPNVTVRVSVPLQTDTDRSFTYTQTLTGDEIDPDGSFEVTVPYPTAETLGPQDGYADASVTATEGYTIQAIGDTGTEVAEDVSVDEAAIQNGDTVSVTLEPAGA